MNLHFNAKIGRNKAQNAVKQTLFEAASLNTSNWNFTLFLVTIYRIFRVYGNLYSLFELQAFRRSPIERQKRALRK